jgi:hypothetical protein
MSAPLTRNERPTSRVPFGRSRIFRIHPRNLAELLETAGQLEMKQ